MRSSSALSFKLRFFRWYINLKWTNSISFRIGWNKKCVLGVSNCYETIKWNSDNKSIQMRFLIGFCHIHFPFRAYAYAYMCMCALFLDVFFLVKNLVINWAKVNEKNGRKKLSHAFRFTLISNINFDVRTFSNFSIQSTRFIFICEQSAFDSLQSLAAVYKSSAICLCVYLFHTDAICQSVGEFIALFDEREREKKSKQT